MIPEEFEADAEEATKKVRKAGKRVKRFRDSLWETACPANDEQNKRLWELVGHDGLHELTHRAIQRQISDAFAEPDPPSARQKRRQ